MIDALDLSSPDSVSVVISKDDDQQHHHGGVILSDDEGEDEEEDSITCFSMDSGSTTTSGTSSIDERSHRFSPCWPSPTSTAFQLNLMASKESTTKASSSADMNAKKKVRFEKYVWEITELDVCNGEDEQEASSPEQGEIFYSVNDYESFRSHTRELLCPKTDKKEAASLHKSFGQIVVLLEEVYCQLCKASSSIAGDEVNNNDALDVLDDSLKQSLARHMKEIVQEQHSRGRNMTESSSKTSTAGDNQEIQTMHSLDPEEWIGFGHRLSGLIYPQMTRRREQLQLAVETIQMENDEEDTEGGNMEQELSLSCRYYTQTPALFAQVLAHMQMMMPDADNDDN